MRSELVRRALGPIPQRFLLARVAMKITNKFHQSTQKGGIPESINASFQGVAQGRYVVFSDLSLSAGFCPSCRCTPTQPLEFWRSPTDGLVCIDPFHIKSLPAPQEQGQEVIDA